MSTTTATLSSDQRSQHITIGLILLAWFGIVLGLSLNGTFIPPAGEPPLNLLVSGLVTLSLFALAYCILPAFRAYVLGLDMRLLILLHGWRMLGLGFDSAGIHVHGRRGDALFACQSSQTRRDGVGETWVGRQGSSRASSRPRSVCRGAVLPLQFGW